MHLQWGPGRREVLTCQYKHNGVLGSIECLHCPAAEVSAAHQHAHQPKRLVTHLLLEFFSGLSSCCKRSPAACNQPPWQSFLFLLRWLSYILTAILSAAHCKGAAVDCCASCCHL